MQNEGKKTLCVFDWSACAATVNVCKKGKTDDEVFGIDAFS